jgi:predicted HTH transcriptional regulator
VQRELAAERSALRDYLHDDPLLQRFFDVFLFEDVPASDRRTDAVYLQEVTACDLYLGLLGNDYGVEDSAGLSPTEREFVHATELGKPRLIYVKGPDDTARHTKMRALVQRAGAALIRRRFSTNPELRLAVYASLVQHLEDAGSIQSLPFDEQPCPGAALADLDEAAVCRFLRDARGRRQLALSEHASVTEVLTHLNLMRDDQPTRPGILLFGRNPQRFVSSAEVRCMHFHGTAVERPAPSYRVFKGSLPAEIDQAADFALSKLGASIGTRSTSARAPVRPEIPPAVIREALVNAVAHRDYAQPGAVQVSVFADRVEVWNPGGLLPPLTLEQLRKPHRSLTRNARVCEGLYLAGYIEKYGTRTLMMIRESVGHALPEPDFAQTPGEFVATLWRDWLAAPVLATLRLNGRQQSVIPYLKIRRQITNAEYRKLTGTTERTATRDLDDLVRRGVVEKTARTGRGTAYRLSSKPATNPPNQTSGQPVRKQTRPTPSRAPRRRQPARRQRRRSRS